MTKEVLELLLHRDARVTEEALKQYYTEDDDLRILLDAERYSLFAGGKRICFLPPFPPKLFLF